MTFDAGLTDWTPELRAKYALDWFQRHMPAPQTELAYANGFQLLVAVILSAQCTDVRVNAVTPALFKAFPTPQQLAAATFEQVYPYVRSVSYPNNKTKHLIAMARMLVEEFGGEVPSRLEDLQRLPGVGRKTANVVASVLFNAPTLAVDTHVFRVSNRLGLTDARNPLQSEKQLVALIPQELIPRAHHWLILHGRYVCKARKPDCERCGLANCCAHFEEHDYPY